MQPLISSRSRKPIPIFPIRPVPLCFAIQMAPWKMHRSKQCMQILNRSIIRRDARHSPDVCATCVCRCARLGGRGEQPSQCIAAHRSSAGAVICKHPRSLARRVMQTDGEDGEAVNRVSLSDIDFTDIGNDESAEERSDLCLSMKPLAKENTDKELVSAGKHSQRPGLRRRVGNFLMQESKKATGSANPVMKALRLRSQCKRLLV